MRTNLYTKVVLTVTALLLAVITIKTAVSTPGASPLQAANGNGGRSVPAAPTPAGPATGTPPISASPKVSPRNSVRKTVAAASSAIDGDCAIPQKDGIGCAVPVMKPSQAVQIIEDDLDATREGFGRRLHPTAPPDLRTYDERMRDEAERIKNQPGNAVPRPGTMTVTAK